MANVKKVTASADASLAGFKNIYKVVLVAGAAAAATVIIFDGATQAAGIDIGKIAALTGDTKELCFDDDDQGHILDEGLSLTITGAGAVVYVYY